MSGKKAVLRGAGVSQGFDKVGDSIWGVTLTRRPFKLKPLYLVIMRVQYVQERNVPEGRDRLG